MKYILFYAVIFLSVTVFGQKSLKFDGINDLVVINGYKGVTGTADRTMEAWIKIPTNATDLPILYWGRNTASQKVVFRIQTTSGTIDGNLRFEVNGGYVTGTTDLRDNKWHHVAVVWKNDGTPNVVDAKLYVDGSLETVNSSLGWAVNTASSLDVNLGIDQNSNRFVGEMDEVRIWSAGLTQTNLRDWMCKKLNSAHPQFANLEGYWKVDTLQGNTVIDHSGKGRNGTLNNGTLRQNFGAPIGDVSSNLYSTSGSLFLIHPDGDSVSLNSISGNPNGFHIYRRDDNPNYSNVPSSVLAFDTSRHWGIHFAGGNSAQGQLTYSYTKNSHYSQYSTCFNELLNRTDNQSANWSISNSTNANGSFQLNGFKSGEIMIGYAGGKASITGPNGIDTAKGCAGDSMLLSNSSVGLQYQWLLQGSPIVGDTTNSLKTTQVGLYSLIVNGPTCNDTSNEIYVSLNSIPAVSLQPFSATCASTFSVPLAGGLPLGGSYLSTYASGNMFIVGTSGPGNFKITYRYSDANGCSDTTSQFLKVDTIPYVNLAAKSDVCIDSATHQLSGGFPTGGSFTVNGNATSQFDAATLGAGNQKIVYTFADANQCVNKDSIIVKINSLPTVSLNLLTKNICDYAEQFGLDGNNPSGGLFSGTGVNGFTFNPKNAGIGSHSIKYTYKDRNTGCSNIALDTISVVGRPAIPTITQKGDEIESSIGASYQWFDKNGVIREETNKSFKPKREGDYSVIVKNSTGCESEQSELFTYKLSGQKDQNWNSQLSVFPIPADESITIEVDSEFTEIQFSIYDISGSVVAQGDLSNGLSQISVSHLASNLYFIEIHSKNGLNEMRKIVVEH